MLGQWDHQEVRSNDQALLPRVLRPTASAGPPGRRWAQSTRLHTHTLMFSSEQLHQGSDLVPKGAPVRFQTAFSSAGQPVVVHVLFNMDRHPQHVGPQLNEDTRVYLETTQGEIAVLLGADHRPTRGVSR